MARKDYTQTMTSPSPAPFAITPHAANRIAPEGVRAIYVGTAGNITLAGVDGNDVLFKNLPAGYILPVLAYYVRVSGTTATDLVGLP